MFLMRASSNIIIVKINRGKWLNRELWIIVSNILPEIGRKLIGW